MTGTARDEQRQAHDVVVEILPWYVNATLSGEETTLVEAHLPACAVCRDELARCRALARAARSAAEEPSWSASPRHLARVLAHVEARERARPVRRVRALLARLLAWASATPRPVRWALAVEGLAALALAVMLVRATPQPPGSYVTLARPERPAVAVGAERARLHLVVAEETTEREFRDLLRGVAGVLVGGPSARGVYTVELPVGAAERERVEAIAARLEGDRRVRFVAVAPAGSP